MATPSLKGFLLFARWLTLEIELARKEDVLTPGSQVRLNGSKSWAAKTRFACCPKQGSSVGFDVTNRIIGCEVLDDHRYHVGPRSNATKLRSLLITREPEGSELSADLESQ